MDQATTNVIPLHQPPDINKRIGQYVHLRDHIKKLDEEHKTKMQPFKETLAQLNDALLAHLNTIHADSASSEAGTVYRTAKSSASIADMTAFWDHVVNNNEWDLLDRKANVTAVEDYIAEHNAPPPGVNFNKMFVVGVRRK